MKKNTKRTLIASAILVVLGIVFIITGAVTYDGKYSWQEFAEMGKLHNGDISPDDFDDKEYNLVDTFAEENIDEINIKLDISALKVSLSEDDKCRFYVEEDNDRNISADLKESVLVISDDDGKDHNFINISWLGSQNGVYAKLELPDKEYENLLAEIDMGCILIENLKVDNAEISCDMGYIQMNKMYTHRNEISCNMGSIQINDIHADDSNISCDMGQITAEFAGNSNEYKITKNCDMGDAEVIYSETQKNYIGEKKYIDVDCDMGSVTVLFTE